MFEPAIAAKIEAIPYYYSVFVVTAW